MYDEHAADDPWKRTGSLRVKRMGENWDRHEGKLEQASGMLGRDLHETGVQFPSPPPNFIQGDVAQE